MHIQVSGKQVDTSDALQQYVTEQITSSTTKFFPNLVDAHVVFSKVAHMFRADASVHVGHGIRVQSRAEADAVYAAFDQALERIEKQLRRYKRRLKNHHQRQRQDAETQEAQTAQSYVLVPESEEDVAEETFQPVIVAETETAINAMTVGEAVMRMDLADEPALLFRNRANGELNMIYRRRDGHIGWIDPANQSLSKTGM